MPRRVEAQFRNDWVLTPALRNLFFRWQLMQTPKLSYEHRIHMSRPTDDNATELLRGAAGLYGKLWKGSYTHRGRRRAVAGDTTRLQYAEGLSPVERKLLRSVGFMASHVSGK